MKIRFQGGGNPWNISGLHSEFACFPGRCVVSKGLTLPRPCVQSSEEAWDQGSHWVPGSPASGQGNRGGGCPQWFSSPDRRVWVKGLVVSFIEGVSLQADGQSWGPGVRVRVQLGFGSEGNQEVETGRLAGGTGEFFVEGIHWNLCVYITLGRTEFSWEGWAGVLSLVEAQLPEAEPWASPSCLVSSAVKSGWKKVWTRAKGHLLIIRAHKQIQRSLRV